MIKDDSLRAASTITLRSTNDVSKIKEDLALVKEQNIQALKSHLMDDFGNAYIGMYRALELRGVQQ